MNLPTILDAAERFRETGDLGPDYERGVVFTYEGLDLPHLDRLSQVTCKRTMNTRGPRDDQPGSADPLKKMKHPALMRPVQPFKGHPIAELVDNPADAVLLQTVLAETDYALRNAVKRFFPRYHWLNSQTTWRFAAQQDEWLHFDFYAGSDPYFVRAFVNLDSEPRTWMLGPLLDEYCIEHQIAMKPGEALSGLAERASYRLDRNHDGPLHLIAFNPGQLWVLQSQLIAHAIVYGRRMAGLSLGLDPKSLSDPAWTASGIAKRIRTALDTQ